MKIFLIGGILFQNFLVMASPVCEIKTDKPIKIIKPKNTPDFFFKASKDGKYIYYISKFKNYRINTITGQEEDMPGHTDGVPSPDGKLLTYLKRDAWDKLRINLSPMREDDSIDLSKNIEIDNASYQSIGGADGSYKTLYYKSSGAMLSGGVITNTGDWWYRDIKFNDGKIEVSKVDFMIPNSDNIRLGMINKSGLLYAGYDTDKNKTKIMKTKTGKVVDELPFGTGKVDFSYDDKKLLFHLSSNTDKKARKSELDHGNIREDSAVKRNIFIYDRNTKSIKQLTDFNSGNAYFPIFLGNGQIQYLYIDSEGKAEFHLINEPVESVRSFSNADKDCFNVDSFNKVATQLSKEWLKLCKEMDSHIASVAVLNISSEHCYFLGRNTKATRSELDQFCKPKIKVNNSNTGSPGFQTLNNKCMVCHADIPLENSIKLKVWKDKMQSRINSSDPAQRMPLGGQLSEAEKKELNSYIDGLLKK